MSAPVIADLERAVAELQDLKTPALQMKWRTVFGSEPPRRMRAGFLARAIAYRLQKQVLGTLRPDTQKTLDKLALSLRRSQGDDVWRYINSPTGRRYLQYRATGTAGNMPKFNARTLTNMPVPVPRNHDFATINRALDLTLSFVEQIEQEIRSAFSLVDVLDRAVLQRAFMGALVPQDAADEPAVVLLEKVRAGRLLLPKTPYVVGDQKQLRIAQRQKGQATVAKKRSEVQRNHLQQALREMGGSAQAKDLWKGSEMDIEEFYKQLRDELGLGQVRQRTGKGDTVSYGSLPLSG